MKNIVSPYLFCFLACSMTLSAQDPFPATCKTGPFTFHTKKAEGLGTLYCVTDSVHHKTDTMLIAGVGEASITCFCNDTLATFYANHTSTIEKFQFKEGKWQYIRSTWLPVVFPMVGTLIDGQIYEKYRHELVAPDKVISKLTMLRASDGKLVPVKKYSIEYKIIPGSYEAVVVKKVEEKL